MSSLVVGLCEADRALLVSWTRSLTVSAGRAGWARFVLGLDDEVRSGRPKIVDDAVVLAVTFDPPLEKLMVTQWSAKFRVRQLGIGDATVARAWWKHGVKPWRWERVTFSTDPE